jgi:hypothetical protein
MSGESEVPAKFFREWYHRSDLIYYLEAFSDHTIAETTTYGQWWIPERLAIAIEGLPSTSNRYYIDGMRTDDRFQAGSSVYVPNMQQYNLQINTHTHRNYTSRWILHVAIMCKRLIILANWAMVNQHGEQKQYLILLTVHQWRVLIPTSTLLLVGI